jgi:hypothetical protein
LVFGISQAAHRKYQLPSTNIAESKYQVPNTGLSLPLAHNVKRASQKLKAKS